MKILLLFAMAMCAISASAQIVNTATQDTTDYHLNGNVSISGYLDNYYAFNFNRPEGNQPYLVSMSRQDEINVNLAYIDVTYSSAFIRAQLTPGFGTYVNVNYANEDGSLKNLIQANIGVRLSKKNQFWLDAGVFGSPYTNESAISKDQITYTRSIGAENVPYYLAGLKLTAPLSSRLNAYVYLVNGWQQITDKNPGKGIGTQLEYRPTNSLLLNWNTFAGKETSAIDSVPGMRYFTDAFFIYQKRSFSATGSAYAGLQQSNEDQRLWWQINLTTRYHVTSIVSLSGRLEYFKDGSGVLVLPITGETGFNTAGASLGLNIATTANSLLRMEVRQLFSDTKVYSRNDMAVNGSTIVTGSFCIWFK
jgi:hypothetical protein